MKPLWIALCIVFAVCAATAGYLWQTESARALALAHQLDDAKANAAKLQAALDEANEKNAALTAESEALRRHRQSDAEALAAAPATSAATPAPSPGAKPNFLASMFKDPSMRKMIAAQQSNVMRGYYAKFVQQMHLPPDQAEKFYKALEDRQMAMMDSGMNVLSGSGVDADAVASAQTNADAELQQVLGGDQFNQFKSFEKSLPDRMALQQLTQQLAGTGTPLQDTQSDALVQIMSQERASMPNFQGPQGMQAIQNMTDAQIDQLSQQYDAMNQRVYNRAMNVLNQPQLDALAQMQKVSATTTAAGLKMARSMMQSSSGGQQ